MKKVVFKLSMPNVGSWNGQWSGQSNNYIIKKNLTDKKYIELGLDKNGQNSWYYNFGDGWGANVSCETLSIGKRLPKSDGFCGYDWMVDSIMHFGVIKPRIKII